MGRIEDEKRGNGSMAFQMEGVSQTKPEPLRIACTGSTLPLICSTSPILGWGRHKEGGIYIPVMRGHNPIIRRTFI